MTNICLHVPRRLYPDMAFFQRPTDYPCQLILDPQNDYETLRRRVEQTTLKAQTVNRNRSGVTNVSVLLFVCYVQPRLELHSFRDKSSEGSTYFAVVTMEHSWNTEYSYKCNRHGSDAASYVANRCKY